MWKIFVFVCLLLFIVSVCLNMHVGGIINLCNPVRQEVKATMKLQRVIEDDNLNGSIFWIQNLKG